jgi:hypothetical protein
MGLIGEEFDSAGAASVFTAEQTHLLRPCGGGNEGEGDVERGQDALNDTGCAAKSICRSDALSWPRPSFLYHGVGAIGVRAQEVSQANSVNLIDGARPALHLSCRHIDNDEVSAIQIEDGEGSR